MAQALLDTMPAYRAADAFRLRIAQKEGLPPLALGSLTWSAPWGAYQSLGSARTIKVGPGGEFHATMCVSGNLYLYMFGGEEIDILVAIDGSKVAVTLSDLGDLLVGSVHMTFKEGIVGCWTRPGNSQAVWEKVDPVTLEPIVSMV